MKLKDRIMKGWNARRALYAIVGCIAIAQAFFTAQYFLILFGGYFLAMGILGFGCAGGSCNYTMPRVLDKEQQATKENEA